MPKTIVREKKGKSFIYLQNGRKITDTSEIHRIKSLVIPPAWEQVKIAADPKAKIQARGRDAAGRLQAIYHPEFRAQQEQLKFAKITEFAQKLPLLRKQIEHDLRRKSLPKDKVVACVVKLIDEAYFRVGNERYAKENNSYGITTMRSKHLEVKGVKVVFDFMGKSGKHHHKVIADRRLANIIKQLDELPGQEIFTYIGDDGQTHGVSSRQVNEYIKSYMGEDFSAKNFRTWGGTLIAIQALAASELAETEKEKKKIITQCVKKVAKRLGNTPAIARGSYIDPYVFEMYTGGADFTTMKEAISKMKPKKYMSAEEEYALKLLMKVGSRK